jgi:DNA-binding PadR family transcriptional regulator
MDERHLLLLGLLLNQSQHGYSINEFIEKNLGHVSGMKRATAYALLEKLEAKGLVQMETETSANYPPRKVYTITPAGRAAFFALLQQYLLATGEGSSATDIALMFADRLEHDRAEALLRERAARLRERIKELGSTPAHAHAPGVDLAVQRKLALLKAEVAWIQDVLRRREGGPAAATPGNRLTDAIGETSEQR